MWKESLLQNEKIQTFLKILSILTFHKDLISFLFPKNLGYNSDITMLYKCDAISQFCSITRKLHSSTLTFCPVCKLGQKIVNLNSSPPSLLQSARTTQSQSTWMLPITAIEREIVNARI